MFEHTIKNINLMLVTTFKYVNIALSKRDTRNDLDSIHLSTEKVFIMQIITKRSFVASTATPLIQIAYDVYADQHFEIVFSIKDETSKKALAHNLKKTIANFALVQSEFSESDFLEFLAKAVTTLDDYRGHLFDAEKVNNISQLDFLKLILQEIAVYKHALKAKEAKKALKK